MLTQKHIFSLIDAHKDEIKKFGVKKLGLFGSYIRNEQTPESDIDMLAEFEDDKETFRNFMNFVFFLEELFGREVEVVTPDSISPYLSSYILEEVQYVPFLH
jgi:predicted nucleotidyltransferase